MRENSTGADGDNKAHFGLGKREPWLFIMGKKWKNGKKFAAEYCCIGKKLYLCTTANEGSVCARRFARAKKERGS